MIVSCAWSIADLLAEGAGSIPPCNLVAIVPRVAAQGQGEFDNLETRPGPSEPARFFVPGMVQGLTLKGAAGDKSADDFASNAFSPRLRKERPRCSSFRSSRRSASPSSTRRWSSTRRSICSSRRKQATDVDGRVWRLQLRPAPLRRLPGRPLPLEPEPLRRRHGAAGHRLRLHRDRHARRCSTSASRFSSPAAASTSPAST